MNEDIINVTPDQEEAKTNRKEEASKHEGMGRKVAVGAAVAGAAVAGAAVANAMQMGDAVSADDVVEVTPESEEAASPMATLFGENPAGHTDAPHTDVPQAVTPDSPDAPALHEPQMHGHQNPDSVTPEPEADAISPEDAAPGLHEPHIDDSAHDPYVHQEQMGQIEVNLDDTIDMDAMA